MENGLLCRVGFVKRCVWGIFLLALVVTSLNGCGPAAHTGPPNLLLISLDTTRAKSLSTYGYAVKTSPNISRFAAEGARFDQAYSSTATTGPSHASLFTSTYPYTHGFLKNGMFLADEKETLAEILGSRGYRTHGIAGSFALSHQFGFAQGFTRWEDDFDRELSSYRMKQWAGTKVDGGFDRPADDTTRRAQEWLQQRDASAPPFFLFVHYFDPHAPYGPPKRFLSLKGQDLKPPVDHVKVAYDGEIAFVDEQVGVLLEELDRLSLAEHTLVVIMGDHGEGMLDHGYRNHGIYLYDEAVNVPLLMRLPGVIPSGGVVESPVGGVDIAPSILGLLFGEPSTHEKFQGEDLASAIREGREPGMNRPVFLTRRQFRTPPEAAPKIKGEQHGVRVGNWKYLVAIEQGEEELYDLAADPGEKRNLAGQRREKSAKLAARLEKWRAAQGPREPISELDPNVLERLKVMGYVE